MGTKIDCTVGVHAAGDRPVEINAGEGTVHITGTADSPVTAMRFQKELEKAWGGKIYIEKQNGNQT
ncbi:MAG: hypothetical protein ACLUIQ_07690 [Dialister invisus]